MEHRPGQAREQGRPWIGIGVAKGVSSSLAVVTREDYTLSRVLIWRPQREVQRRGKREDGRHEFRTVFRGYASVSGGCKIRTTAMRSTERRRG